jgi:ribosomal protein S18 acetylase RimI-like enzyme
MEMDTALEFGDSDRRDIYEYVEAHGSVSANEVRDELGFDERAFGHHLAILRRDGLLEIDHGDLRIAIDGGAEEEFRDEAVEFTIRPARQEDLTGLVGVMRQTTEAKTYVEAETVADLIDHEEVLLRHNELETRMFFVATVDGEVVGWVHLNAPEVGKLSHTAELTLGVLEEYRGHGIGSHLLERGVEWGASHGFEKLYQSVPSTNEGALEFLAEHGWEQEAVREGHYKLEGEYLDEVMLAKRLE